MRKEFYLILQRHPEIKQKLRQSPQLYRLLSRSPRDIFQVGSQKTGFVDSVQSFLEEFHMMQSLWSLYSQFQQSGEKNLE